MSTARSRFERRARRVRRALARHPRLQDLANRVGVPAWRWHLRRLARSSDDPIVALPAVVEVDRGDVARAVRLEATAAWGGERDGEPAGLVRGGSWDRETLPLPSAAPAPGAASNPAAASGATSARRHDAERPWAGPVVVFDRRGRACWVEGSAPLPPPGEPVSALVAVRHRRWATLATEIRAYALQRGGKAYQPHLHPDLADLPSDQGHERFDLLLAALPIRSGTLVDLGANSGYFSHRFEEIGFECVAVERSEKEVHILAALRDARGRRFEIRKGSLTRVALPARPDVVLALNIFHHFLKTESGFRELRDFLGRLEARYMLFEAHRAGDPQMARAAQDMPPADFAEWVRRHGGFESAREIGAAADRRPLFLLSRAAERR